ncbi:hypothetical protein AB0J82_04280 [Asanoa sp. NPDC049518]|uniref:hypothetical protein n=1 Tax=unclassified Asanoa TaxID=2685164 RepID=UPI00343F5921
MTGRDVARYAIGGLLGWLAAALVGVALTDESFGTSLIRSLPTIVLVVLLMIVVERLGLFQRAAQRDDR